MVSETPRPSEAALKAAADALPITWGRQLVHDVALAFDRFAAQQREALVEKWKQNLVKANQRWLEEYNETLAKLEAAQKVIDLLREHRKKVGLPFALADALDAYNAGSMKRPAESAHDDRQPTEGGEESKPRDLKSSPRLALSEADVRRLAVIDEHGLWYDDVVSADLRHMLAAAFARIAELERERDWAHLQTAECEGRAKALQAQLAEPSPECPFCGCDESPVIVWDEKRPIESVRVHCPECDASGPPVECEYSATGETHEATTKAALTLWGRRIVERDPEKLIALLQDPPEWLVMAVAQTTRALYCVLLAHRWTEEQLADWPHAGLEQMPDDLQQLFIDALRAALEAEQRKEVVQHNPGSTVCDRGAERPRDKTEAPSVAGGAAPLSEGPAQKLATALRSKAGARSDSDARAMALAAEAIAVADAEVSRQDARIAELERERDSIKRIEAIQAGRIEEFLAERDALQAQLAERDPEKLIAEIERRAVRTDLLMYRDGSVGGDERAGEVVECICITEDALLEALK